MRAARGDVGGTAILVGGYESGRGRELPSLPPQAGLEDLRCRVVGVGRELGRALDVAAGEADAERPLVVLPMTLGRDPRLCADTARTVRWVRASEEAPPIALAAPFGSANHLIGWLRAACLELPEDAAVLIAATPADPFDDAELYRVAALVRTHGRQRLVEVGFRSPAGRLEAGLERCRRLGAERVAIVPAEFCPRADAAPLLSPAVIARVVAARVAMARHRLIEHGDDGVATALAADHEHGFAHSHEGGHQHGHTHAHDHLHDHHSQMAVG